MIKVDPNLSYKIYVRAYSKNTTFSESDKVFVVSYPNPQSITLNSTTPTSMIIEWTPPENMSSYEIQYSRQDAYNVVYNVNKSLMPEHHNFFMIDGLDPKTRYNFSILLKYVNSNQTYRWTSPQKIEFETLGDVPSSPGRPSIEFFKENVYKIVWNASKDNGAQITEYVLESFTVLNPTEWENDKRSKVKRSVDESNDISHDASDIEHEVTDIPNEIDDKTDEKWIERYTGPETHWIATGAELPPIDKLVFRVKSYNSYGWSNYSPMSNLINNTLISSKNRIKAEPTSIWLWFIAILITISIVIICFTCGIICEFY
jgi:proto-oncogene tyrosine-protein kinase ROS